MTTLAEAEARMVQAKADLAKQEIKRQWATILVAVLREQESCGATVPDFRAYSLHHEMLFGLAEGYYGARLDEIEVIDNIEAFQNMVTETVGDQLAEFELAPQLFRSHQTGKIRLFFLRPSEHPNT